MSSPWETLGIAPTDDVRAVRKAYAQRLKAIDPERDVAGFTALRQARDWAMRLAEHHAAAPDDAVAIVRVSAEDENEDEDEDEDARDAADPVAEAQPAPAPAAPAPDLRAGADVEAMRALRELVFDRTPLFSHARMAALVEQILGDPAMQNLEHAEHVEHWFADLIVQGVPRSDPMIDRAIAYFRWDAPELELRRPPAVSWILQRAGDRHFEVEQRIENSRLHRSLRRLRRPPPTGMPGRIESWFAAPHVEYTILLLQSYHPTVLHGLHQQSYAWWVDRIHAQHQASFPFGALYRMRSDEIRTKRRRRMAVIGAALTPVLLFAGLIVWGIVADVGRPSDDDVQRAAIDAALKAPVRGPPKSATFDDDLDLVLQRYTGGVLTAAEVRTVNPGLYARLQREWDALPPAEGPARDQRLARFQAQAGMALAVTLRRALRGPDDALVLDHAGYFESRLRWIERGSAEDCVAFLDGAENDTMGARFTEIRANLLVRAVRTGTPPPEGKPVSVRYTVPDALAVDAMHRASLSRAAFADALRGKGPARARCNTQIALIDAALVRRDAASLGLLRAMFGG